MLKACLTLLMKIMHPPESAMEERTYDYFPYAMPVKFIYQGKPQEGLLLGFGTMGKDWEMRQTVLIQVNGKVKEYFIDEVVVELK